MPYQWPQDPQDLFVERRPQMVNTGLPVDDVNATSNAISEMWPDAPGGWVYEWSRLAAGYAADGRHDLAALAYGWARFPVLADQAKRAAHENQLAQYLLAAPGFPVDFIARSSRSRSRVGSRPFPCTSSRRPVSRTTRP